MKKNILIAFDDSENAFRAVEFVEKFFTPDCNVTLFSVFPDTDALFLMKSPELSPYFVSQKSSFLSFEDKKKELIRNALKKARDKLLEAGFESNNINIKAECRRDGIARDIVNESHNDYDIIVLGRRGLSAIKEFFIGSVSHKVFNGVKDNSILVVN
ncbi:MAG: universal stress protein [Desulfobacterales bacterium]|nr:universal stress protein [Desulfobacterales bacterium]MCP4160098.1 universal stress protein [Deltaproteobacteria bacterium]